MSLAGRSNLRCYWHLAILCFALGTCGCSGNQSALNPAGIQAERISELWWLYFWVCITVYTLVMLLVLGAVFWRRSRQAEPEAPTISPSPRQEQRFTWVVSGAVLTTTAILFTLLIGDYVTGRSIHAMDDDEALRVRITGHQWWWEIEYHDPVPSNIVTTANELHLPVARPVYIELRSNDVIHSLWIPNLHGKADLIPGYVVSTVLRVDRPGTYFGQCAEYCGYQHANMRLVVVAETEEQFDRWLRAQRQPAREPSTDSQRQGQQVFLGSTCIMCHTIQGTPARATVGPNLTHVGSRSKIAAGTLPNTRGHLGGWIVDPQRIKPGVRMPLNTLAPDDLRALLDYLESLK